jgi:hypothetical protein
VDFWHQFYSPAVPKKDRRCPDPGPGGAFPQNVIAGRPLRAMGASQIALDLIRAAYSDAAMMQIAVGRE